jgi:hypothetical protein
MSPRRDRRGLDPPDLIRRRVRSQGNVAANEAPRSTHCGMNNGCCPLTPPLGVATFLPKDLLPSSEPSPEDGMALPLRGPAER